MIRGNLIDDLCRDTQVIRIPTDNLIVFATGHQQIAIVR